MGHIQRGYIYEGNCAGKTYFYVRYNATKIVDGQPKRVQVSERLVANGASALPEEGGGIYEMKVRKPSKALKLKVESFMPKVNRNQYARTGNELSADMSIADFWEQIYLSYRKEIVKPTGKPRKKPSTVRGYKQIWN